MSPVKPEEVVLPSEVIEIFNELIRENWEEDHCIVNTEEAVSRMKQELGKWEGTWLEIESVYRRSGWKVDYKTRPNGEEYYLFEIDG